MSLVQEITKSYQYLIDFVHVQEIDDLPKCEQMAEKVQADNWYLRSIWVGLHTS